MPEWTPIVCLCAVRLPIERALHFVVERVEDIGADVAGRCVVVCTVLAYTYFIDRVLHNIFHL